MKRHIIKAFVFTGLLISCNTTDKKIEERHETAETDIVEDTEEKTYAIKEAELQSRMMSFADRFSAVMITALEKYEVLKPSKENHLKVKSTINFIFWS